MKIKAIVIAILLVVNLGLLTSVVLSALDGERAWAGTAQAQAMPVASKYMMVIGRFKLNEQALYVVNLERRSMAVFTFNTRKRDQRLTYSGRASLAADFR